MFDLALFYVLTLRTVAQNGYFPFWVFYSYKYLTIFI